MGKTFINNQKHILKNKCFLPDVYTSEEILEKYFLYFKIKNLLRSCRQRPFDKLVSRYLNDFVRCSKCHFLLSPKYWDHYVL